MTAKSGAPDRDPGATNIRSLLSSKQPSSGPTNDQGGTDIGSLLDSKTASLPTPYQAAENIGSLLDRKASASGSNVKDQGGLEAQGRVDERRGGKWGKDLVKSSGGGGGRGITEEGKGQVEGEAEGVLKPQHVNFVDPSIGVGAATRSKL